MGLIGDQGIRRLRETLPTARTGRGDERSGEAVRLEGVAVGRDNRSSRALAGSDAFDLPLESVQDRSLFSADDALHHRSGLIRVATRVVDSRPELLDGWQIDRELTVDSERDQGPSVKVVREIQLTNGVAGKEVWTALTAG